MVLLHMPSYLLFIIFYPSVQAIIPNTTTLKYFNTIAMILKYFDDITISQRHYDIDESCYWYYNIAMMGAVTDGVASQQN